MHLPRITRFWMLACCFGLFVVAPARLSAEPTSTAKPNVDFERHLMGLFGRLGCFVVRKAWR